MKHNLKKILLRISVLFIILLVFFKWVNITETITQMKEIIVWPLFVAFIFYTIMQIIKADRFYELCHSTGERIPPLKNIFVHLFMPLLGRLTPGKIGDATKIFLLQAEKKNLLFAAIIEKLADFIILGLFALLIIFIDISYVWYYLLFFGILIVFILILIRSEWLLNKVTVLFLKKNIFEDKWFVSRLKKLKKGTLLRVFYSTCIGWFANFVACYFLAMSLQISISLFLLGAIFATAIIIGLISSLPGGFGAREASLIVLLSLAGVAEPLAQTYSVLYVFFILASESFLAGIGYFLYLQTRRQEK